MNVTLQRWIRCGSIATALLLAVIFAAAAEAADSPISGPGALIITYHVAPVNRPAFRRELETSGLRQLQRWKDEGLLDSYRLLFNRYVDSDNWDALAVLRFSSVAKIEAWKRIEQIAPAGLAKKALALTTAIHTAPVDLVRNNSVPDTGTNSVFVVIPYVTLVPAGDYLKYADGYVIPQFEGWMAEGVLSQYDFFVSSFPAGRPWSSLVILEYKDEQSLAERNAIVARVRAKLAESPQWKAISDNKKSVRDEKQVVIADPIALH